MASADAGALDCRQCRDEVGGGVVSATEGPVPGEQMRIAEMDDHALGG
jgi:hypothetical protein